MNYIGENTEIETKQLIWADIQYDTLHSKPKEQIWANIHYGQTYHSLPEKLTFSFIKMYTLVK